MSEWKEYDFCELIESMQLGTSAIGNEENYGVPLLKMGNLRIGGFNFDKLEVLEELDEKTIKPFILKKGDFLFNTRNTLELVGKSAVWNNQLPMATFNSNIMRIKFKKEFDDFFLGFYFSYPIGWNEFKRISTGTTSVAAIYSRDLVRCKVKVPDYKNQQKIACILSTVDAVIEKTEAAIVKYRAIKAGMMHDLFTRGIDLKTGKLRPKYEDAPELYKKSELGWVPKEWDVETLEGMADIITGSTPPTSNLKNYGEDYMFVSPSDINENQFIKSTEKMLSKEGFLLCRKLLAKSICVVCIGSTIGKIAFTVRECATNQQINTVVSKNINLTTFLYYAMLFYNDEQFRKETGLQAVPIVNKSSFSKFNIPLIEEDEGILIAKKLLSIDKQIQADLANLHKHQQIKQALMSDLLTGKVPVKYEKEKAEVV